MSFSWKDLNIIPWHDMDDFKTWRIYFKGITMKYQPILTNPEVALADILTVQGLA